jgi:GcrA cell cycle regulator
MHVLDRRTHRTLTKMWTQGMTASQIADELGGVSRNAVIGKAHRLGLQSRPSPVKPNEEEEREAAPAPLRPRSRARSEAGAGRRAALRGGARRGRARSACPSAPPQPQIRSIGPGGFIRQTPGEQQSPIPPAPPRRLVPAKPSPEIADKTSLLDLNEKICKWPIGHPGEPDFHFCGAKANPGFPVLRRLPALRPSLSGGPSSSRAATAARRRRFRSAARASAEAGRRRGSRPL